MNSSKITMLAACAIQPADCEPSETRMERMERYTNYLEGMILRKNEEMRLWRRTMTLRLEKEIQKAKVDESVMIHQTRQAAMGELLKIVAHHWRQPLNIITLIVQNMKDAWEAGELDSETLNNSISRAKEQISLLARSIEDFNSLLKPANNLLETNASASMRTENFPDSALFGIRLPAVPMERSRE